MTNPTCFIAMPIVTTEVARARYGGDENHFAHVLEHLFVPAVEAAGFSPIRPFMRGSEMIPAQIIHNLERSDLVLCDLSDHNPNVFFELGIRTALDRPVAMVCDGVSGGLPFDTNTINTHFYDESIATWVIEEERTRLAAHIKTVGESSENRNSLWTFFGLTQRATERLPTSNPLEAKIDLLAAKMESFSAASVNPQWSPSNQGPKRAAASPLLTQSATEVSDLATRLNVEIKIWNDDGNSLRVKTEDEGQFLEEFRRGLRQISDKYDVLIVLVDRSGKKQWFGRSL